LRCDAGQWRKCRTLSPVPPLKNGAAVGGSRLKIATDVAGMLEPSETPARTGPFVLMGENGD
jgi:hypothetical protein